MLTAMDLPFVSRDKLRHGDSSNASNDVNSSPRVAAIRRRQSTDAQIERALDAMKREPTRRWTVRELARVAGLSRSAFARRFTQALGVPPLKWLGKHRLELARERLVSTDLPLAAIAAEVGYACEFAFAKAFKRLFGRAPGLFRRACELRAAA
jgi:transcriptional regulator GlxA family with amidase domain